MKFRLWMGHMASHCMHNVGGNGGFGNSSENFGACACFNCGEDGHLVRDCTGVSVDVGHIARQWIVCAHLVVVLVNCVEDGHLARDCTRVSVDVGHMAKDYTSDVESGVLVGTRCENVVGARAFLTVGRMAICLGILLVLVMYGVSWDTTEMYWSVGAYHHRVLRNSLHQGRNSIKKPGNKHSKFQVLYAFSAVYQNKQLQKAYINHRRTNAELYKALLEGDDAKADTTNTHQRMKQETLYFLQQPPTTVGAAAEMLCRAPSLLTMTDKLGETALFHTVRYGKTKISNFLEEQVIRNYPTEENLRAGTDPLY
nr:ankyrin repeat-containing domain, PGG domain protein [Tanacetum cinerariifolium]